MRSPKHGAPSDCVLSTQDSSWCWIWLWAPRRWEECSSLHGRQLTQGTSRALSEPLKAYAVFCTLVFIESLILLQKGSWFLVKSEHTVDRFLWLQDKYLICEILNFCGTRLGVCFYFARIGVCFYFARIVLSNSLWTSLSSLKHLPASYSHAQQHSLP